MIDSQGSAALQIERSVVTKLVITGAFRLDPVTVFLEDLGSRSVPLEGKPDYKTGEGKITISCSSQSWTAYWGGMGERTVSQFVAKCDASYVLNCLNCGMSTTRFSGAALVALAWRCIVDRRRTRNWSEWALGHLDAENARALFNRLDELRDIETTHECWHHSDLLSELFGDEWHYPVGEKAVEENHEYTYLLRIVQAVQQALSQPAQEVAA